MDALSIRYYYYAYSEESWILPVTLPLSSVTIRVLLHCQKTSQELLHGFVECLECDCPEEKDDTTSDTVDLEGKPFFFFSLRKSVHRVLGKKKIGGRLISDGIFSVPCFFSLE